MFVILSGRKNRQLNTTIQDLHHRAEHHRGRRLTAEHRIEQALALLEGKDTSEANLLRATLKGEL
ncbi:hypothetical protein [Streptomyces sp. NBC_01233]|uniref:hypothetical protein n=1 Tax=Streptomyces sp. NBC_01233 TaxID=2903787 RepID=UPI002E11A889|nr:hypothetical protein OG332_47485 [Streptomyces sp. NBC_01233]